MAKEDDREITGPGIETLYFRWVGVNQVSILMRRNACELMKIESIQTEDGHDRGGCLKSLSRMLGYGKENILGQEIKSGQNLQVK